jgi:hypothetical protein
MSANEKKKVAALGGILRRVGNFDPTTFESNFNYRLILQKTVYLMQQFGLNIGYSFSWYLRGPYSPTLTRDTYELIKIYPETQPVKFADSTAEKRFCEFIAFIKPIARDYMRLERIASIHFLFSVYPKLSSEEIFLKSKMKIPSITHEDFQQIKATLRNYGLLEGNNQ